MTSGKLYALKLTMQTEALFADRFDVAVLHCTCVDENGNTVPDATPYVSFNTTGNGFVIGTGSDIADHNIPACIDRKMRAGVIAALIGTRGEKEAHYRIRKCGGSAACKACNRRYRPG